MIEADFITKAGLRAVVLFGRLHRCGYVAVPQGHPLYGKGCSDILPIAFPADEPIGKRGVIPLFLHALEPDSGKTSIDVLVNVHGSITYASGNADYPVPSANLWWFGFDCGHLYDDEEGGRPLQYCIDECESMAEQLNSIAQAILAQGEVVK